jgi:hypothetical protein
MKNNNNKHKLSILNSCSIIYPRNMVCFKYITVNTLHKGDNKDDDDDDDNDTSERI